MNDKRNLTGHPWHIEYLKMDENDSRRDKRRCIYFERNTTYNSYCKRNGGKCVSSSHCQDYSEDKNRLDIKYESIYRAKKAKEKFLLQKIQKEKILSEERKSRKLIKEQEEKEKLINKTCNVEKIILDCPIYGNKLKTWNIEVFDDDIYRKLIQEFYGKNNFKDVNLIIKNIITYIEQFKITCLIFNDKEIIISESTCNELKKYVDISKLNINLIYKDANSARIFFEDK